MRETCVLNTASYCAFNYCVVCPSFSPDPSSRPCRSRRSTHRRRAWRPRSQRRNVSWRRRRPRRYCEASTGSEVILLINHAFTDKTTQIKKQDFRVEFEHGLNSCFFQNQNFRETPYPPNFFASHSFDREYFSFDPPNAACRTRGERARRDRGGECATRGRCQRRAGQSGIKHTWHQHSKSVLECNT
jgi:hypothetical protein